MFDDLFQQPDTNQEENINEEYVFADGTLAPSEQLDTFMEEFAVAKEEKGAPDEPTPEELETEEEPVDEEELSTQTARNTAQFLVATIDEGASMGLAWLSKEKQDDFRAGKEQRKNLENLFTKYCKEKNTEIPIQWQIFFCIATVYAAKVPYAIDRRTINKERELIRKLKKELEEERHELLRLRQGLESERRVLNSITQSTANQKKNGKRQPDIPAD